MRVTGEAQRAAQAEQPTSRGATAEALGLGSRGFQRRQAQPSGRSELPGCLGWCSELADVMAASVLSGLHFA